MQTLEIPISEKVNVTSVDLFDVFHARKVFARFGAAYDRLPDEMQNLTPAQNQFLDEAIDYLEVGGRVVCVRLALLAEMLKSRSWQNSTGLLKDGGVGIGTQFLEETFDSEHASRRRRIHSEGAHRVLRALLPEGGARIKGAVVPEHELLAASGYRDRTDFRELLLILDRELHLITPADTIDEDSLSDDASAASRPGGYQLTHDFLIAPIRQWIEYRNRTTKQGKARLRLEEFSELYQAKPRLQSLPTLGEYVAIRRYHPPATQTDRQRAMMSAAFRWHLQTATLWLSLAMLMIASVSGLILWQNRQSQRIADQAALERMLDVDMTEAIQVADVLHHSTLAREEALKLLNDQFVQPARRARACLILLGTAPKAATVLTEYSLSGPVQDVVQLAKSSLFPFEEARTKLQDTWQDQSSDKWAALRCLHAGQRCALEGIF